MLHLARTIIVVTQADVPGLWALERHLSALASFGLDPARLQIIINRWHRPDEEALKAFEKKAKRAIFARIPNDFRQRQHGRESGRALVVRTTTSLSCPRFRQMASQLAGVSSPRQETKRGAIFELVLVPFRRGE